MKLIIFFIQKVSPGTGEFCFLYFIGLLIGDFSDLVVYEVSDFEADGGTAATQVGVFGLYYSMGFVVYYNICSNL